jgi:KipI family sensor histidine kinase inhibitor
MNSRVLHSGDGALLVQFDERIDPEVNARAIALAASLQASPQTGILDVVPTFRSVTVYFDPLRTDVPALRARLEQDPGPMPSVLRNAAEHVIPVEYGGAAGPDLPQVASAAGLSEAEVIARHTDAVYRVFMLGFLPGFAYLGPLDPQLALPRRATPRPHVPAGSVAVAGLQTGIYPMESPGGWHLIGRTDVRVFDPNRPEPFLLKAGDSVRFVQRR